MIISAVGEGGSKERGVSPGGRHCLSPLLTPHHLYRQVCIQMTVTEEEVEILKQLCER